MELFHNVITSPIVPLTVNNQNTGRQLPCVLTYFKNMEKCNVQILLFSSVILTNMFYHAIFSCSFNQCLANLNAGYIFLYRIASVIRNSTFSDEAVMKAEQSLFQKSLLLSF